MMKYLMIRLCIGAAVVVFAPTASAMRRPVTTRHSFPFGTRPSSFRHDKNTAGWSVKKSNGPQTNGFPGIRQKLTMIPAAAARTLSTVLHVTMQTLRMVWKRIQTGWKRLLPSTNLSKNSIMYQHLKGKPNEVKALQLLEQIQQEFAPIIERRGYNVKMVGEFTDDRDAIVEITGQPHNLVTRIEEDEIEIKVLGYNMPIKVALHVRFFGLVFPLGRYQYRIGLRLRTIENRMFEFYSYSELCETMCHELAHCVHHDHSKAFYQLMAELQQEHARLMQHQRRPGRRCAGQRRIHRGRGRRLGESSSAKTKQAAGLGFSRMKKG